MVGMTVKKTMAKIFKYDGYEGNNPKAGMVEADSAEKAIAQLTRQGVMVINIAEAEVSEEGSAEDEGGNLKVYKPKAIKNKDKVLFTKKLTTMVKSGLPILKTLKMLEEQSDNKHMRSVAHQIRVTVEGGSTLSEAFGVHDKVFDQVY